MSVMVRSVVLAWTLSLLAACTTMPADEKTAINDPYENTNRKFFAFNLALDNYALEPAANLYKKTAP